jgi:hypothetical protein
MKRREFIGLAAVGAAGIVLPATASFLPAPPHPRLLEILHDEQIVRDIGLRYREMAPGENNARLLAAAILAEQDGTVSAALSARRDAQVKNEFTLGHTVKVNGWILSVTEARQCALYSMQYV